jgi:hypothetical protein
MRQVAQSASDAARTLEAIAGKGKETSEQRLERLPLGTRQRAIVKRRGLRSQQGMSVADIAEAIGKSDMPNMYATLEALERRGVLERVPGAAPRHVRLTETYR